MKGVLKYSIGELFDYLPILAPSLIILLTGPNLIKVGCESLENFLKNDVLRIAPFYFALPFIIGDLVERKRESHLFLFLHGNNINIKLYLFFLIIFLMSIIMILNIPFWLKEKALWNLCNCNLKISNLIFSDFINFLTFILLNIFILIFLNNYILFLSIMYSILVLDILVFVPSFNSFPAYYPVIASHIYANYLSLIGSYGWLLLVLLVDVGMGVIICKFWRSLL